MKLRPKNHYVADQCGATAQAARSDCQLLKAGGIGNARVTVVSSDTGQWVIKDFTRKNYLFRHTLGRLLVQHEWRTLSRLQGLPGVPAEPVLIGPLTLAYRFVAGETLKSLRVRKAALNQEFFCALERLVGEVHARGFAHLDLRNGKNILLTADGRPHLLDFQSCLRIGMLPKRIRRLFEAVDYSGVYKWWARLAAQPLDGERKAVLHRINQQRRLWLFNKI